MISGINPDQGPTAGGTLVTISGENLPESPLVFFGDRRAEIVSTVAPTFILVDTPAGPPGLVDVTVKDQLGGDQATFPAGFLYVGPGEEPTTTTTTWPDVTNTTAGPTTTLAVTTTNAHPATTTADQPPTITGSGGSLDDWLDSVLRTPDGLTLAPPAADDRIGRLPTQLWAGALCDQPVCPGWVLED